MLTAVPLTPLAHKDPGHLLAECAWGRAGSRGKASHTTAWRRAFVNVKFGENTGNTMRFTAQKTIDIMLKIHTV